MSDIVIARIRTVVPAIIAAAITWLATNLDVVISESSAAGVTELAVAVVLAVWYIVVSQIEKRYPKAGWLLGYPKKPTYNPEG